MSTRQNLGFRLLEQRRRRTPDPLPAVMAAQAARAQRVQYAGVAASSFSNDGTVSGGTLAAGHTFINTAITTRCRQAGPLRRATINVGQLGTTIKFIVLRPNGGAYDVVGKSELFTPSATGAQSFDFAAPIQCATGDVLGVWIEGTAGTGTRGTVQTASTDVIYSDSEATGSGVTFPNTIAGCSLNLTGFGPPPVMVVTGDSIHAGHNGVTTYNPLMFETGVGDINSEPAYRMVLNSGVAVQYQNAAKGSQTYDWVRTTGMPAAVALGPAVYWIHCGVNDISLGRTWAAVVSDLDAIRAMSGMPMVFDEILPWPLGSDSQAATVRTWNANIATWVAAQTRPTFLNRVHDPFAVTRPSTGQLDDMNATYAKGDGVHLSQAGVDLLASMGLAALRTAAAQWTGPGMTVPATPTVTAGSITTTGATLATNPFSDPDLGDSHAATQWQVTTAGDTGYASPGVSTGDDATHLTTLAVTGLTTGQNYIARARHKDAYGHYSIWSVDRPFTPSAPPASFDKGFDFRATPGYVTDPANCIEIDTSTGYYTAGIGYGWDVPASIDSRDRNASVDPRLAGINFQTNSGSQAVFRVDLPVSGGTYDIRLAIGDYSNGFTNQYVQIRDGATPVLTVDKPAGTTAGSFYDASGTLRTAAAWPGSNVAVSVTISGNVLRLALGTPTAKADFSALAHLFISRTA